MADLTGFQARINDTIPLTRALGVQAQAYDGQSLLVSAPLAPNHNHQGTGFGGSLYSVAVVAAWGVVELKLADLGLTGNVVVQGGQMDYIGPVTGDFYAIGRLPDPQEIERFCKSLARAGRGRLGITADIHAGKPSVTPVDAPLASFSGRFVVQD